MLISTVHINVLELLVNRLNSVHSIYRPSISCKFTTSKAKELNIACHPLSLSRPQTVDVKQEC